MFLVMALMSLFYWSIGCTELDCSVRYRWWDGTVLDINATCVDLGKKCLQLIGVRALRGCDTVLYPYELSEVEATHIDLMEAAQTYFCALYRQPSGTSMENARFKLFTKKKKTTKIMA